MNCSFPFYDLNNYKPFLLSKIYSCCYNLYNVQNNLYKLSWPIKSNTSIPFHSEKK